MGGDFLVPGLGAAFVLKITMTDSISSGEERVRLVRAGGGTKVGKGVRRSIAMMVLFLDGGGHASLLR